MTDSLRCLLVADFTIDGLSPFLTASEEMPPLVCTVAPFDQTRQVLLDEGANCWQVRPDVAVVWTRPEAAVPSFGRLVMGEPTSTEAILTDVERFADCLRIASRRLAAILVPAWTWPPQDRGVGLLSLDSTVGPAYHLMRMNTRLAESIGTTSGVRLLDAQRWVASVGPTAFSPKLWHLAKIPFGPDVFRLAAADIKAALRALRGLARKLIVVDLDDTLWGGVVGDVGWENLQLGGHDPVGEAFRAFQQGLKALTRRGIVLGIASKNTEAVALEAMDRHPEMVLRRQDFAGWRIDWNDKAQNIMELTTELNLGLDSVVFIDDSPAERARVRQALPQVLVPEWPADKLLYGQALSALSCFDAWSISQEDQARAQMYAEESGRKALKASAQSLEEYLSALELKVECERLGANNLARAAQLLNKTNQLNLATRRMPEAQLRDWASLHGNHLYVFRVVDRFGDYGLTGLASFSVKGKNARIADFVLSCRVMGRGVEQTMLHTLIESGRRLGLVELDACFVPTAKNAPCKGFLDEHSGFTEQGDCRYVWDLSKPYPLPGHVQLASSIHEPSS